MTLGLNDIAKSECNSAGREKTKAGLQAVRSIPEYKSHGSAHADGLKAIYTYI